ncbi:SDR family oxidoreductase [Undibacterium terreum]|uniref:Dehydrogenase n=1 Tax=Undibacterium terreum TaxID=1224302 RepID=A0A916U6C2_9BURK|nr:SDR family oxidoreductase [Undibacterium terreum]GGC61912.1 dehydrogenase [Undibacterium terreum]
MSTLINLQQQHVVVIGGTSGLGRAVAQAAKEAGAKVTVLGRSATSSAGINDINGISADITDAGSLAAAMADIGPIQHLVITSGARGGSPKLAALSHEEMQLAFNVKVFGYIQAIQAALPYLADDASITLTSGILARKYGAGGLLKSIVNASVEAMGKNLAKELAPRRVNVVSPGVVDTELWGTAGSEGRTAILAKVGSGLPAGRVGQADEVAQVYLLAMQNGFMTGAVLDVEGGGLL